MGICPFVGLVAAVIVAVAVVVIVAVVAASVAGHSLLKLHLGR